MNSEEAHTTMPAVNQATLGPAPDNEIQQALENRRAEGLELPPEEEAKYDARIRQQAQGNHGAAAALQDLLQTYGPQVYDRVAPQLGTGADVYLTYNDRFGRDIRKLVRAYGGVPPKDSQHEHHQ